MDAVGITIIICLIVFVLFTFVIMFGAPFLPTLSQHVPRVLDISGLKKGDTLLELGSGDGRVLIEAAKRGIYSTGYELNPLLVIYSWLITRKYRKFIKVRLANFWNVEWPKADGVFVFLLKPYMDKLDKKIIQYSGRIEQKVVLVSFGFEIAGKIKDRSDTGLSVYEYLPKKHKQ